MHLIQRTALIIAALAATTSLAWAQEQQSAEPHKKSILGTWQVLRHGVNCNTGARLNPDFPVLMTFNAGGTLNAGGLSPGSKPGTESPEYGNWSRQRGTPNGFTFRDVSLGYNDDGTLNGRAEITATVTLSADGNSFTQETTVDVFDADGNLLFSFCGAGTATRFK